MLQSSFNKNIKKIINILEFPMYIVTPNYDLRCTCRDRNDRPNPKCPKCLGIGYRIQVRKILGAYEPDDTSMRFATGSATKVVAEYFFDSDKVDTDWVKSGSVIVRDNEVDVLQMPRMYRSDSNDVIYVYAKSTPKNVDLNSFLENFKKLVSL